MTWIALYNFFGIKDFIYFISAPQLQDYLFPVKLVFAAFGMLFLAMIIYFMINSSWLQYKFLEDTTEFFSWQSYGAREITKKWDKIKNRSESGTEADYKLAIIDADDLLTEVLENRGYNVDDFKSAIESAKKLISVNAEEVLSAHEVRNSIVYNSDYKLSADQAKKMLDAYESAIKSVGIA